MKWSFLCLNQIINTLNYETGFFFLKTKKKPISPVPRAITAINPKIKKVRQGDDRGGITTSGVEVKVADACDSWVAVKVRVIVGGIEVLVFVMVGVTVTVEVAVLVEVAVAVGGRVGTVWGSSPPQTTFWGTKRNNKRKQMSGNSFNPNCLFKSYLPVQNWVYVQGIDIAGSPKKI